MKKLLIITTALAVAALSGCASTGYNPPAYQAKHSRAYNIARAGHLVTGIKDTTVPRDQVKQLTDTTAFLTDTTAFGTAYVLAGSMSTHFGMTSWQGGLLSLANLAIGPKKHGARNSLIAWMPMNEAVSPADAQAKLLSHVKVSIDSALSGLGVDLELVYDKDWNLVYYFYKDEWNCPTWVKGKSTVSDMCAITVRIVQPWPNGTAPSFVSGVQGQTYAFTSGGGTMYNRINVINGADSHAPQQAIYAALSKQLPSWAYLYLAPKAVILENGDKVGFPYLLEQGKPEFFIYPES